MMQFAFPTHYERIAPQTKWHAWFAWRPVMVARGDIRWLETVERRGGYEHHKNTDARRPWRWEYRAA